MCTAFLAVYVMVFVVVAQPASAAAAVGKAATQPQPQPQPQPAEMKIPTVGSNGKPQNLLKMLAKGWAQEKMRSCKKIVQLHMAELHMTHPSKRRSMISLLRSPRVSGRRTCRSWTAPSLSLEEGA